MTVKGSHAAKSILSGTFVFLMVILLFIFLRRSSYDTLEQFGLTAFQSRHTVRLLANALIVLTTFWLIKKCSFQQISGIVSGKTHNKLLLIAPLLLLLMAASNAFEISYADVSILGVLLLLLSTLSVGFFEEITFRGFLQSYYLKHCWHRRYGIYFSVLIPALLFGVTHLVVPNDNFVERMVQVGYAFYFGAFFGAILLRTGKFYPIALTHGLFQFFSQLDELKISPANSPEPVTVSVANSLLTLVVLSPLLIFALFQLSRMNKDEIGNKMDSGILA